MPPAGKPRLRQVNLKILNQPSIALGASEGTKTQRGSGYIIFLSKIGALGLNFIFCNLAATQGRKRGGLCRMKVSYSAIEQIYCIVCFAGKGAMSYADGKFWGS
jgi:hypothetical protein